MSKKQTKKHETPITEEAVVVENLVETEIVDIDVQEEGVHEHIHIEKTEEIGIVETKDEVVLDEFPPQFHSMSTVKDSEKVEACSPKRNSSSITDEINAIIKVLEHDRDFENAANLHNLLAKLGEVKIFLNYIETNIHPKAKQLIEKIISNL